MRTVATDDVDAPATAHDHFVPCEHGLMRERAAEAFVEVHHHLGDAALGRRYPPSIDAKSELLAQGRLDAVAVEDFAFDFRGLECFVADKLDLEDVLILRSDMLEGADELARAQEKLPFQRLQGPGVVGE